jgi:hypothetical protein
VPLFTPALRRVATERCKVLLESLQHVALDDRADFKRHREADTDPARRSRWRATKIRERVPIHCHLRHASMRHPNRAAVSYAGLDGKRPQET